MKADGRPMLSTLLRDVFFMNLAGLLFSSLIVMGGTNNLQIQSDFVLRCACGVRTLKSSSYEGLRN